MKPLAGERTPTGATVEMFLETPLGALPPEALGRLVASAEAIDRLPGDVLVEQGGASDAVYVILEGTAEVTLEAEGSSAPLGLVGAGDLVGQIGALREGSASATVTATTSMALLKIPVGAFNRVLADHPEAMAAMQEVARRMLVGDFLREVGALAGLERAGRLALAEHLTERSFAAGEPIVQQGVPGDECFVIRSGSAEVQTAGAAARIGPGSLIGESALLTDAPRVATVRAAEPCVALVMSRAAFLRAVAADRELAWRVVELMRLRERPTRVPGVEAHDRTTADGEAFTILKNPATGVYFRLSRIGRFVWDRLDGTRNVRELALEYLEERGGFAPQAIADVVAGLSRSGFVATRPLVDALADVAVGEEASLGRRLAARARAILTWRVGFRNIDRHVTWLYRTGGRFLFTAVGLALLSAIAVGGLVTFFALPESSRDASGGAVLVAFAFGTLFAVALHEAGHALSTKAAGREVGRAGVGWFWFAPVAFVDTSDAWLATRVQRVGIALAGPASDLVFAGACAIAAWLASPRIAGPLWILALASYVSIFRNLNPLIELDGYYAFMHLVDRPNLRRRSLSWLGHEGLGALRHPSRIRGHAFEAAYAVASVVYLAAAAVLIVVLYRAVLEDWVAELMGEGPAQAVGWVFALVMVVFMAAGVVGDIHAAMRISRPSRA